MATSHKLDRSQLGLIIVWLLAMASVVALFLMGRGQVSGIGFYEPEDGSVRPIGPLTQDEASPALVEFERSFRLSGDRLLTLRLEDGSEALHYGFVTGPFEALRMESGSLDLGGVPERLALLRSPRETLLTLVRGATGTFVLAIDLEGDVPGEPVEWIPALKGVGPILDFECTPSGGDLALLYESAPGSGKGMLIAVAVDSLPGEGVCRLLAPDQQLPLPESVDLGIEDSIAEEGSWEVRLSETSLPVTIAPGDQHSPAVGLQELIARK